MSELYTSNPTFTNPPIVETIMGIQFDQLQSYKTIHHGVFWDQYLKTLSYETVSDESLLPTYIESFDDVKLKITQSFEQQVQFSGRLKARSSSLKRIVQLQADKLYLSWNRTERNAASFSTVKQDFLALVTQFEQYALNSNLGTLKQNLWEVMYVNQIPPGELWQEPNDWHYVLPKLFPNADLSSQGLKFATYNGEWHYEIEPRLGRIHLRVAKMVMNQKSTPTLYLSFIARGQIGENGVSDLASGLKLGHDSCLKLFSDITSDEAKGMWGVKS